MLETNPFTVFNPPGAKYLVLGSFAAKDGKKGHNYNWYYSNGRNQFWPMLEVVYGENLTTKKQQQELFARHKIAVADIIRKCKRLKNSSLDTHLTDFVYNTAPITKVFKTRKLQKVLFTSRFVENQFRRHFAHLLASYPTVDIITLPSPSPRYAQMAKDEKIMQYKKHFPKQA